eukprot:4234044-Amphidinium_carterae.1
MRGAPCYGRFVGPSLPSLTVSSTDWCWRCSSSSSTTIGSIPCGSLLLAQTSITPGVGVSPNSLRRHRGQWAFRFGPLGDGDRDVVGLPRIEAGGFHDRPWVHWLKLAFAFALGFLIGHTFAFALSFALSFALALWG